MYLRAGLAGGSSLEAFASQPHSPLHAGQACRYAGSLARGGFLGQRLNLPGSEGRSFRRGRRTPCTKQVRAALFDPPPFSPKKLRVEYLPGAEAERRLTARRYTLTHNDLTGALTLSIGRDYNRRQLSRWYTRMMRDEVLAEWVIPGVGSGSTQPLLPRLHVYCHVSGEESWPAPPPLRSFIFQREMTLVLDTIAYAEQQLLVERPQLRTAPIRLHLSSHLPHLNQVLDWGTLGDRDSWPRAASTILQALLGPPLPPPLRPRTVPAGEAGLAARDGAVQLAAAGGNGNGAVPLRQPDGEGPQAAQQQLRRQQQQQQMGGNGNSNGNGSLSPRQQQRRQEGQPSSAASARFEGNGAAEPSDAAPPAAAPAVAAVGAGRGSRRKRGGSSSIGRGKQAARAYNGVASAPKQLLQPGPSSNSSSSSVVVAVAANGASLGAGSSDALPANSWRGLPCCGELEHALIVDGVWQGTDFLQDGLGSAAALQPAVEVVSLVDAASQVRY